MLVRYLGVPFLVFILLNGAGCLNKAGLPSQISESPTISPLPLSFHPNWAERALPFGPDHTHTNLHEHRNLSTPNFEVLGYEPLVTDWSGRTAGGHACGALGEKDGRRLSIVHSIDSDVAFVVVDTTDLERPKKIGEFVLPNTQAYDVTLTPDLRYVIVGTSLFDMGPDLPPSHLVLESRAVYFRDACTGNLNPLPAPENFLPWTSGILLVDLQDPSHPKLDDFLPLPVMGGHSVRAHEIDGQTLILASVLNSAYKASYYHILGLEELAGHGRFKILSTLHMLHEDSIPPGSEATVGPGAHDGFLQKHPITGEKLAYLAAAYERFFIYNIDDVAQPRLVSRWDDWSVLGKQAPARPALHEALPIEGTWDGRHYTFLGEECPQRRAETPSCLVLLLDTTNPKQPAYVGAWTLPTDLEWGGPKFQFSTHYIALLDRTLFVSMYHGGLWALDVSTPEAMKAMPSIGVFLPDRESPHPVQRGPYVGVPLVTEDRTLRGAPVVEDLEITSDGKLIVLDLMSGLYTVQFDASYPAPAPPAWPMGTS